MAFDIHSKGMKKIYLILAIAGIIYLVLKATGKI
jgi:hypothetical protein